MVVGIFPLFLCLDLILRLRNFSDVPFLASHPRSEPDHGLTVFICSSVIILTLGSALPPLLPLGLLSHCRKMEAGPSRPAGPLLWGKLWRSGTSSGQRLPSPGDYRAGFSGWEEREEWKNGMWIPSQPTSWLFLDQRLAESSLSSWAIFRAELRGLLWAFSIIHQLKKEPVQFLPSAVRRCSGFSASWNIRAEKPGRV